jgi:hypothetical protein
MSRIVLLSLSQNVIRVLSSSLPKDWEADGSEFCGLALDDQAVREASPISPGGTALPAPDFGTGRAGDGGRGAVDRDRTNRWPGPYAVIEMEDPSLKGTDFPLSSTEKTSNSTIGMHHFALSRDTSFSFSSRQRNLNESGYSSALFRLGTSFHDSINVMVPGCGKAAG